MLVCGTLVNAGRMKIDGFTTLTNDPGFDTTRFAYFDYHRTSGTPRDCNYQSGDSGSPAFIMIDGRPVLVGTASGQDPLPRGISRNYINYIPASLSELDSRMEKRGYHVRRHEPPAATIALTATPAGPLHPKSPGSIRLETRNTGKEDAHNLALTLTFPAAILRNHRAIPQAGLTLRVSGRRMAGSISPGHQRRMKAWSPRCPSPHTARLHARTGASNRRHPRKTRPT